MRILPRLGATLPAASLLAASLLFCTTGCGDSRVKEAATSSEPTTEVDGGPSGQTPSGRAPEERPAVEPSPDPTSEGTPTDPVPDDRALPMPPARSDDGETPGVATTDVSSPGTPTPEEMTEPDDEGGGEDDGPAWDDNGPTAEDLARKAFLAPPDAKPLSEKGRLWIAPKLKRVYVDGYVALKRGPLEMFACPVGTKEHESIVAVLAKSQEVHAGLLAVGATPGSPVEWTPEYKPPSGQVIRVWVCWYDEQGQFRTVDARQWVGDLKTEKTMDTEWVFAGSGFWEDPEDKREYYLADSGDMICVSNFSSALLDVAIPSSADAGSLRFVPYESAIPEPDTPVRLVLVPVPDASDSGDTASGSDLLDLPTAREVPRAKSSD